MSAILAVFKIYANVVQWFHHLFSVLHMLGSIITKTLIENGILKHICFYNYATEGRIYCGY